MRLFLPAGIVLLLSSGLGAQDGLRSASLPERPIATQPPGPGDLYRAGPNTYRPQSDRKPPRREPRIVDRSHRAYRGGWWYWPYLDVPAYEVVVQSEPIPDVGVLLLRLSPPDAQVFLDGAFEGTAGEVRADGIRVRPGVHRVRVEAAGHQTATFDARVEAGETVTRSHVLERVVPPSARTDSTAPAVQAPPPVARTMYVIPLCYAGDRPPDASTGCDLTRLRTIR